MSEQPVTARRYKPCKLSDRSDEIIGRDIASALTPSVPILFSDNTSEHTTWQWGIYVRVKLSNCIDESNGRDFASALAPSTSIILSDTGM